MMAAVNPCGFPLLPAYLEFFVGRPAATGTAGPTATPAGPPPTTADSPAVRAGRAVTAAAFATVGFLVLFGTLGLVTQFGWSALADRSASASRYAMVVLGVAMIALGVVTLTRRSLKLPLPQVGTGTGLRRPAALAVF